MHPLPRVAEISMEVDEDPRAAYFRQMRSGRTSRLLAVALLTGLSLPPLLAQRTGFTKEEFIRRRAALLEQVKDGVIVLFGDAAVPPGTDFRQDNDFFYFTGVEDSAARGPRPHLPGRLLAFPPERRPVSPGRGPDLLEDAAPRPGRPRGRPGRHRLRRVPGPASGRGAGKLYVRLSPRDSIDDARSETALMDGRRTRIHYNDQLSVDQPPDRRKFRERYPPLELVDIAPVIDGLRAIKTPEEIAILRRNGRLSAEAVKQAMLATRPGVFEYEIEAAAMAVVLKGGAKGAAYAPIVGSGPNSCILHYEKNDRRVAAGDLVLMDFGADLDHMAMDITRTWPVSGRFSAEQREVYEIVLEVEKACLEAYKPGANAEGRPRPRRGGDEG